MMPHGVGSPIHKIRGGINEILLVHPNGVSIQFVENM